MEHISTYQKWEAGELTLLGSFQTTIFQAFRLAGSDNKERLCKAFPYWFSDEPNRNTVSSEHTAEVLKQLTDSLVSEIRKYLDETDHLEFHQGVNISYANEEMKKIERINNHYMIVTSDNNFGQLFSHDIDDPAAIAIQDLLWILRQIESEKGR